jgi:SAM-dependent methyltransferase
MTTEGHSIDERDRAQREEWARAADAWERRQAALRESLGPVSDWMIDALDPQPGQRVLELAAGPGETGFMAAQRLGAEGRLISSDQANEMVDVARRRASELALENVDFKVLDAQQIELESASVDGVLCRFGYMLMSDRPAALRETRRVLKDGGRIALAVWDTPDRNLWMAAPAIQLVSAGALPMPDPDAPTPFSLADQEGLGNLLSASGFDQIRIERIELQQRYESIEDFWEVTMELAAPIAAAMERADAEVQAQIRAAVGEMFTQFADAEGRLTMPASAVGATAVARNGT